MDSGASEARGGGCADGRIIWRTSSGIARPACRCQHLESFSGGLNRLEQAMVVVRPEALGKPTVRIPFGSRCCGPSLHSGGLVVNLGWSSGRLSRGNAVLVSVIVVVSAGLAVAFTQL